MAPAFSAEFRANGRLRDMLRTRQAVSPLRRSCIQKFSSALNLQSEVMLQGYS